MNYWTILIFTLFCMSNVQAEGRKKIQVYVLNNSELDTSLLEIEAYYTFNFKVNYPESGTIHEVHYSIDGKEAIVPLTNGANLVVQSSPGKHIFQFFFTSDYYEVYTDSLEIKPQHRDDYTIYLSYSSHDEQSEKPVIYLYPLEATEIEFKINIKGSHEFLYPNYTNGWNFTAQPNGDLEFKNGSYNYLFWEATNVAPMRAEDEKSGFIVEGENIVHFLEEKLTEAGLSTKEQADFITYWGPRMQDNELNFVHFIFNDECDRYATFEISPQPDNIFRIYMLWSQVNESFQVDTQEIKSIDRNGFAVLEWGGQQTYFRRPIRQFSSINIEHP